MRTVNRWLLGVVVACALAGADAGAADFTFVAADVTAGYDPEDGVGFVSTTLDILESAQAPGFPNDTQGFSMGIEHDGSLLDVASAGSTGDLAAVNGGAGPAFEGINISPAGGDGVTVGIVYNLMGGVFLDFEEQTPVLRVDYVTVPPAFVNDMAGTTTVLAWTNTLGDPEVTNTVVVGGDSSDPDLVDGTVQLVPEIATAFLRGDPNDDSIVDIADGIWLLNMLFLDGPTGSCRAAGNANGDGRIDQADAIYVLNYQFLLGPAPPVPFPACGVSEGEECESYLSCEG